MTPAPKTCATVVGLFAIVLAVAWHHAREVKMAGIAMLDLERKRSGLEEEIRKFDARLTIANETRAAQQFALDALKSKPAPVAPAPSSTQKIKRGPSIAERLQTETDTQLFWLASKRSESAAKYRGLFRQLGLSPGQMALFQDALIKREEQVMDVTAIMQARGLAKPDAAAAQLLGKAETDLRAAQRDLLGEAGVQQLREYERTSWLRELVNGVAGGAVVVARDPLSPAQAEQLLHVMAGASAGYQRGGAAGAYGINWDAVDAQARAFLSPAQYALFTTMEPPLPSGARFQSLFYQTVEQAKKTEATANAARPPGG